MEQPVVSHDAWFHICIVIGMVTGLAVTRLLTGLARFVQSPARGLIYPVHLAWVAYLLLAVVHFWWFEFAYSFVGTWTFGIYLFLIVYASLYFFIAVILFPDHMEEFDGYRGYFLARRGWFYGLLAALVAVDVIDTAMKGGEHFRSLGSLYLPRQALLIGLALVGARVADRRFHAAFVSLALVLEIGWIFWRYRVIG